MSERPHDWDDLSLYCVRCGQAKWRALELRTSCSDAENVVGISHVIVRRRFASLLVDLADNWPPRGVRLPPFDGPPAA